MKSIIVTACRRVRTDGSAVIAGGLQRRLVHEEFSMTKRLFLVVIAFALASGTAAAMTVESLTSLAG